MTDRTYLFPPKPIFDGIKALFGNRYKYILLGSMKQDVMFHVDDEVEFVFSTHSIVGVYGIESIVDDATDIGHKSVVESHRHIDAFLRDIK